MSNICKSHHQCIAKALNSAESICKEKKSRLTALRRRVLELVWDSHKPVKAYEILATLQKESSAAKPPTVYRTLDFLLEHQLIHKLHSLNAYVGCGRPHSQGSCFFLICQSCNFVEEEYNNMLDKLMGDTLSKHNFTLERASLEIKGICSSCTSP